MATVDPIRPRLDVPTPRRTRCAALITVWVLPTWLGVVVAERPDLEANQLLVSCALFETRRSDRTRG